MFERNFIPFSIIVYCLVVTCCSKNIFLANRNGGEQAAVRVGTATLPLPPVAMALAKTLPYFSR